MTSNSIAILTAVLEGQSTHSEGYDALRNIDAQAAVAASPDIVLDALNLTRMRGGSHAVFPAVENALTAAGFGNRLCPVKLGIDYHGPSLDWDFTEGRALRARWPLCAD